LWIRIFLQVSHSNIQSRRWDKREGNETSHNDIMRVKSQVSIVFLIKHLATGLICCTNSEDRRKSCSEHHIRFLDRPGWHLWCGNLFEIHERAILRWLLSSDRAYRRPCEQTPLIPIAMRNNPLFSAPDVSDYNAIAAALQSIAANLFPNCRSGESFKYQCGSCANAVSWRCSGWCCQFAGGSTGG